MVVDTNFHVNVDMACHMESCNPTFVLYVAFTRQEPQVDSHQGPRMPGVHAARRAATHAKPFKRFKRSCRTEPIRLECLAGEYSSADGGGESSAQGARQKAVGSTPRQTAVERTP